MVLVTGVTLSCMLLPRFGCFCAVFVVVYFVLILVWCL